MDRLKQREIIKGSVITGAINAVINGVIQYFSLKDNAPIFLSVDSITNNVDTVLGGAVGLAISLAMISTVIAYLNIKDLKVNFFPVGFWSVIKHGFFTFVVTTSLAVIWQRYMGSVEVSLPTALIIIGLIAGIVSGTVNYLTLQACLIYEEAETQHTRFKHLNQRMKHSMNHTGATVLVRNYLIFLTLLFSLTTQLMAQDKNQFLSAKESEPKNFGWMQGFPPPKDKVLHTWDGSFFEFPAIRWSVVHMRQMLPTINVSRGLNAPTALPYALDAKAIDALTFLPWNAQKPMTWEESLWKNYTDGMLVMHKGKVVYERYFSELTEHDVHAVMSLTKSFTGSLAAILAAEGRLDETKLVPFYVPELKNSAYGDATVRQVMDMTTALQYSEDYADPKADIWDFSAAGNPLPKAKDYTGPVGYYQYLETVKKRGKHGEAFGYKTVNADALGWIIAKATGKSVNELLSEKIWRKLGMEQDAYYQVDALGTPFAGGGFNAGLRDMARFGELIRRKGNWNGQQIFPAAAVADIEKGGSKAAFAKSDHPELKGWSYRDMWWMTENKDGAFAARGVHGQTIYIDPAAEMVIVRLASHPVAANSANDATSLPAYQAVADYLKTKK